MKFKKDQFQLKLKGKTAVFIDWGNVYYWKDSLKKEIDLRKLYRYLQSYKQVKLVNFYFGTDVHPASKNQIKQAVKIGLRVITKPVKYLPKKAENGEIVYIRKCDFDLEIGLDCFENIDKFDSFIVFSGDGDFATLYERLIKRNKQVIVVYMYGRLGREVWQIKRGIFKASIVKLDANVYKKMTPDRRSGAQLS
jgi:uncharacterized LabA/DUF88 family protein